MTTSKGSGANDDQYSYFETATSTQIPKEIKDIYTKLQVRNDRWTEYHLRYNKNEGYA